MVPVLKSDGTVCICGDYQLTVNPALKREVYPLPRIEDLFASLSGGKVFSKLDLLHAYQQLQLEKESQKYCTINTQGALLVRETSFWCCIRSCHIPKDHGITHTCPSWMEILTVRQGSFGYCVWCKEISSISLWPAICVDLRSQTSGAHFLLFPL